jgi:hypothetical protein
MKTLSQELAEAEQEHGALAWRLRMDAKGLRTAASRIADDCGGEAAARALMERAAVLDNMAVDEEGYAKRLERIMYDHGLSCGCCGHPLNRDEVCNGDCSDAKCRAHGRAA